MCVHGEDSRTEGVCIQCAGMGGHARARTRRGCTLFRPRHRRTGAQTATDSARLSASAACGMRTCDGYACVCRKVSWCFTPPRGWGPRRDDAPMAALQQQPPSTKAPHHHRRPTTQRARATSPPSSWNVRFTMALAPRRGRPALASARSLPSISSPPSVQPFKPLLGLGGRRALPTGA